MGQGNVESWEEEPNRLTRTLWNGLIRRVCPKRDEAEGEEKEEGKVRICRKRFYWEEDPTRSALEKKKVAVRDLAAILRLMDNPRLLLLDLLELIFERFSEDQGCISCGILVSGIGAHGVSSEHMENMEMFSLSPT